MFSSLELENFKAFGESVQIPLAPITLLFGENSAGKSSILQALSLLKQTRESRDVGALLLPRAEKGIVDLGSFHEFIFDHDLSRSLSIGLKIISPLRRSEGRRQSFLLRNLAVGSVGLNITFQRPTSEAEVKLSKLRIFMGNDENPVAVFENTKTTAQLRQEIWRHNRFGREIMPKDLRAAKCKWITSDDSFWEPIYNLWKERRTRIITLIKNVLKEGERSPERLSLWIERETDNEETRKKYLSYLKDAIEFYSTDFTMVAFKNRMISQQLDSLIGLDGFMPIIASRSFASGFADEHLAEIQRRVFGLGRPTADISRIAVLVGRIVDEELQTLFPMGPSRRPPARWYIFTGTSPQDVGYQGDSMPDFLFRHPDILKKVNIWLDRLDIGYRLQTRSLGPRIRDLFEVQLTDIRRNKSVKVGLPDVGFGVSQLLPFVVQSLASEDQIISIEQPEVHVHPRLQADIGDLLVECAIKLNNQFIIETHSEHLVLRLQKLIREEKLSPDQVSIIYVSRGSFGARVQRLRLDQEGDFLDEWPGGFFPERLRELG